MDKCARDVTYREYISSYISNRSAYYTKIEELEYNLSVAEGITCNGTEVQELKAISGLSSSGQQERLQQ